jgi:predicted DNA-binding protein with PD1-like motif
MKIILKDNSRYILRFDKAEEVFKGIEEFMSQEQIKACTFYGIGSCSEVNLGYFNKTLKEYRKKPFFEDFEIISFQGTGGMMAEKPIVHAHGMFGRTDFTVTGGHVFKMVVSATCEIFLAQLDGEIKRENNPEFNLNLLV